MSRVFSGDIVKFYKERYERCLQCNGDKYFHDRNGYRIDCDCPPDKFLKNISASLILNNGYYPVKS